MAKIKIKYSMAAGATAPTGLTAGELAVNITQRRMFVGDTAGNTVELAGLSANNFTGLNSFAAGISAAGGVTFAGSLSGTTAAFSRLVTFNQGISAANGVTLAGSLSGTTAAFSRLVTAEQGISAAGGVTLASTLRVNGQANFETSTFFNANIAVDSIDALTSPYVTFGSAYINAVAGISTSGITLNGQRITNIVSAVNGKTGTVGLSAGVGITFPMSPTGNTFDINLNYLFGGATMPSRKIGPEDWIALQQSGTPNSMYLANLPALKVALYTEINTDGPPTGFGAGDATSALPQFNLNGFQGACGADPGLTSGFISFTNLKTAIVSDGIVTSFNGRTGAVQGVSSASAGTGISISPSGGTGAITITNIGVQSFNGATGAVTGASLGANTFTGLQTLNAGIFLNSSTGNTFSGPVVIAHNITQTGNTRGISAEGFLYVGGGATFNSSVSVSSIVSPGATLTIQSGTLGATNRGIRLNPYGQIILEPALPTGFAGGTTPKIVVQNLDQALGQVQVSGGNLYLGTQENGFEELLSCNIVFGNPNNAFTTTLTAPNTATSSKTISLPNTTGTIALDAAANTFTALNTFNSGITTSVIYASTGSTFGGTLQVNGGATLAGRVDVGGILDVVGGTTLESTLNVVGVARFAAGVTVSGTLDGTTAAFSRLVTASQGITTSYLYSSIGSTFGGTLQVVGGSTLGGRVDIGGILDVVGGTTLESTLNVVGVARFAAGVTVSGTLDGTTAAFSRLVTFTQGISAAGGITLSGDVAVNGGDITTIASTATLFNANATTLSIGGAATTTNLATAASGLTLNIATGANGADIKNIYIGTGSVGGGSARTTVGYAGGLIVSHGSGITLSDSGGGYFVNIRSATTNITGTLNASGSLNSTGLFTTSGGLSAAGGITFNTGMVVTGTVNASGLLNSTGGLSASGGVTFNTPIVSTRMARTSSAVFDTRTASFSPAEADNGKIFVINISGKTSITVTLEGLSTGWRAKFLCLGGTTSFSSTTGNVYGIYGANGFGLQADAQCVEVHCYASNTYHAS